ncbi:MAG: phosphate/phosphite/phosphonate ABC transporter substrate-binding protein [Bacteriovoracaceae bacterium]
MNHQLQSSTTPYCVALEFMMNYSPVLLFRGIVVCAAIAIAGCTTTEEKETQPQYGKTPAIHAIQTEYVFAIHPLLNSRRYFEVYQPLVAYINRYAKEFTIRLESSKDYSHFEEKLIARKFHFALPNPYQTVQATRYGYTIFGKMSDDDQFRGIIVVRNDSHIHSIEDLRGKAISFPSVTALAAAMMPKYFLKSNGLDVENEAECRYVGSQESSIMNVFLGKTVAGCTWPPPWESFINDHPEVKEAMRIQWQTNPLINNGLIVRDDVPIQHRNIFSQIMFSLHTHAEGKEILQRIHLSQFVGISQSEYVSRVNIFLRKYETLFGSLPGIGGRN